MIYGAVLIYGIIETPLDSFAFALSLVNSVLKEELADFYRAETSSETFICHRTVEFW